MKTVAAAAVLFALACPPPLAAQDSGLRIQGVRANEQVILSRIMADKRTIYSQALQLTDEESRAFWPVYDDYEARVKKIDDRLIRLIDDYAAKYSTLTDADAVQMLVDKMKVDRDRLELQHAYARKMARALPPIKALRYAQVESRIDNELQRKALQLVPLVP